MKKVKQILAIAGVFLLISLYLITLFSAIFDSSGTMQFFFASVVATVIIPALIWIYTFIYRMIKKRSEQQDTTDSMDAGKQKES